MCNPFEIIDNRLKTIEIMLQSFNTMLAAQHPAKRSITSHTLSVKEAASILKVSSSTVYSLVSKSLIPVSKKGGRLYFSEEELLAWVKTGKKQTADEIVNEAFQDAARQFRKRNRKAA